MSSLILILIATLTMGVPLAVLAAQQRPRRPSARSAVADWPSLRERYISADAVASALLLVGVVVTTLGFTTLLSWLGASYQAALPKGIYQRLPEFGWFSFLVPSLLLGILVAALATDLALRLVLGNRYSEYELAFGGGRSGDRGMPLLTFVIAALATAWVTLALDCYSRFEEERIVINAFWGFGEQSYPYSAVVAVVHSSHVRSRSSEVAHPRYFIVFADGRRWCSEDHGRPTPRLLEDDAALADFVCRRADKPLIQVRHFEDWTVKH